MTSLIDHAHESVAPPVTAWPLAGSVAVGLLALVVVALALEDAQRAARGLSEGRHDDGIGGRECAGRCATARSPAMLALLLDAILVVVWAQAIARFLRAHAWSESQAETSSDALHSATG